VNSNKIFEVSKFEGNGCPMYLVNRESTDEQGQIIKNATVQPLTVASWSSASATR
jgi:hypothetical protein